MILTAQQSRKYFEARFPEKLPYLKQVMVRCPFHDDGTASMSVNIDEGVWKCHTGCGEGGLIDFETKLSSCDRDTAISHINEIVGETVLGGNGEKPEAIYQYKDAQGRLVFEKLRFAGKRFLVRKPNGKGGYDYHLKDVRKPLYRLLELLISKYIAVCEGEKDADNVHRALSGKGIAATTNFDGAGKWPDEYTVFFAGKQVVILIDNDEKGRAHGQKVAASIHKYAAGVRILELPNLPEQGDVSDYLAAGYTAEELLEQMKKAPEWFPPRNDFFVDALTFAMSAPEKIEYAVREVIPLGQNGFVVADPKSLKSYSSLDLLLSLSLGRDWLGFEVPRRMRTAILAREDYHGLNLMATEALFAGKAD